MLQPKERFIVDENGQRLGVLLDIEDYQRLLEELEELDTESAPMTPPKRLEMRCCPWSRPWRKSKKTGHNVHGFDSAPCATRGATPPSRGL